MLMGTTKSNATEKGITLDGNILNFVFWYYTVLDNVWAVTVDLSSFY